MTLSFSILRYSLSRFYTKRANQTAKPELSAELGRQGGTEKGPAFRQTLGNITLNMARVTRLELATSSVTGWRSNQLSYTPVKGSDIVFISPWVAS
jgi:hypothetical protein